MPRPRTRPPVPPTEFATWLRAEFARRHFNQNNFSNQTGIARATVNAWFTLGRNPTPALCEIIATALHLPVEEVLIRAGHLAEDHVYQQPDIPGWLTAALDGLEDWELQVVAATARGLREARQDPSLDGLRPR